VTNIILVNRKTAHITIKLLDFVHRPDFYKQKTRFGNWICFRLQVRGGAPTLQKNQKLAFPQAMPEQKKVYHWKQGDYKHPWIKRGNWVSPLYPWVLGPWLVV
jgi:hypothetical protein